MQEIRALGHLPDWTKDAPLALRLHRAKASEALSASQLAELEAMTAFSIRVTGACATEILMTEIRAFGRCQKRHTPLRFSGRSQHSGFPSRCCSGTLNHRVGSKV